MEPNITFRAAICSLPPETIEKILSHVDARTLAIAIPLVSKQFKDISADNGSLWQSKCQDSQLLDFRDNISWKKQFLDHNGHLFPLYGYTIGRVDFKELLKDPRATPVKMTNPLLHLTKKPYALLINGMEFCCRKLTEKGIDTTWSCVEFERGTSDLPQKWKSMGIDMELSLNEYYMLFLLRHSNAKMWHCRNHLGILNARMSSIVKEEDLYFEIFVDIRAEGGSDSKNASCQKGVARTIQLNYSEDLEQEYPKRLAASAEDLVRLRQDLAQRRRGEEVLKQMWARTLANLRSDDTTLIKNTLHDLALLIYKTPNAEVQTKLKSKELLSAIGKFLGHENAELEIMAGKFFIAFIKKFPQDADLINAENLGKEPSPKN